MLNSMVVIELEFRTHRPHSGIQILGTERRQNYNKRIMVSLMF